MSNAILSQSQSPKLHLEAGTVSLVAAVSVAWLALVVVLGASGTFVAPRGTPPLGLLIAVVGPILVFLAAFRTFEPFRKLVLSADLRLMLGMQAWRFGGFTFLALYTYGVLPSLFAWPAGLGDMAIGITAPWLLVALIRRPAFAASRTFVAWNLLGILDLFVAVNLGALVPLLGIGVGGLAPTAPMAHLPLVLIPGYLVPGFVMLHLAALFQARRLRSQAAYRDNRS